MPKKLRAAGGYDLGGGKLIDLGNGTAATDAVNRRQLDGYAGAVYPLDGYGLLAASGAPETFMGNSSVLNNSMSFVRVYIRAGVTITNLWTPVRNAGTYATSSTPNQICIYSDSGVLIDATPNDNALWTDVGWRGGALSGGPIAAQDTPRWVYLAVIYGGMTGLFVPFPQGANDLNGSWFSGTVPGAGGKRRAMYANATSPPSSINPTSHGTATTYFPLIGAN